MGTAGGFSVSSWARVGQGAIQIEDCRSSPPHLQTLTICWLRRRPAAHVLSDAVVFPEQIFGGVCDHEVERGREQVKPPSFQFNVLDDT